MSESSRRRAARPGLLAMISREFVESAGLDRISSTGGALARLHSAPEEYPAGVTDGLGSVQPAGERRGQAVSICLSRVTSDFSPVASSKVSTDLAAVLGLTFLSFLLQLHVLR